MRIAVVKELRAGERRVAASPETVRKFVGLGWEVMVETGAGASALFTDNAFAQAGARIVPDPRDALSSADLVLKVQRPLTAAEGANELGHIRKGAKLVGTLSPYADRLAVSAYASGEIDAFALEMVPRITRAQTMDVLSSQSNLAGYRAVIEAAYACPHLFPMMMTAAGTIAPARVLIVGAGVAGLQAIATARRMGAIVTATDVRAAAREQVESLGATFLTVDEAASAKAETAGGYAKEMGDDYKRRQAELLAETLKKQDIVICTALIPGRPAPRIIHAAMLAAMKPGAIIIDLAAEQGGNCEGALPGQVVDHHGVIIMGSVGLPSMMAPDASSLYARNVFAFVSALLPLTDGVLKPLWDDEILKAVALTQGGKIVHPAFVESAT
ncbi:MAG: Re/Si-specific NAD(P)(+) transhydrogenase subunit alpha [Alphaproteobacteria bacterium]|nr:MAG: Re/Si-specific NAD(P)(+) transhydrogenase subunit alpha [Alphaproteobacteria bacterium]